MHGNNVSSISFTVRFGTITISCISQENAIGILFPFHASCSLPNATATLSCQLFDSYPIVSHPKQTYLPPFLMIGYHQIIIEPTDLIEYFSVPGQIPTHLLCVIRQTVKFKYYPHYQFLKIRTYRSETELTDIIQINSCPARASINFDNALSTEKQEGFVTKQQCPHATPSKKGNVPFGKNLTTFKELKTKRFPGFLSKILIGKKEEHNMPIVDYHQIAKRREQRIFADPSISQQNKQYLRRFLTIYDVSPARLEIFFSNIRHLLRIAPDIKAAVTEQETIPLAFRELRTKYSPATFTTILKVSLRFARWLNNGSIPIGFKDIKTPSRSQMLRKLQPDDMITWKEGILLTKSTNSIQFQALVLSQLDGGFRPSEFVDLNYGDIKIEEHLVIAQIKDGKTGGRSVILHRAAPYIQRWHQNHPTRKPSDPLWLREGFGRIVRPGLNGRIERYPYPAIAKRLKNLGKSIGFEKPLDFYSLRHSSCVLDKLDNLPIDLAAMRHGHSVEHFTKTYGRMSTKDLTARFSKHYGLTTESNDQLENWSCSSCSRLNPPNEDRCFNCGVSKNAANQTADPSERIRESLIQETARRFQDNREHNDERVNMENKLERFESTVIEIARREIERQKTTLALNGGPRDPRQSLPTGHEFLN